MRLAVYARYSDDKQSPHSIEDQVRLCREHAARTGLGEVVEVYADAAISGASLITRPEARRLLADARGGLFDAVLIESLDRISRDQEDIAGIKKRLAFADVTLIAVDDGTITELHVGFKGTMAALYLKDIAAKVRRGQAGRALAGSSPGGLSYGYRVVRRYDEKGEPVRGLREIDPGQAAIVNRIFTCYAAGDSPRAIAAALNHDGIPSPRGGEWGASTICGAKGRRSGILWNESYAGRLVYNRTRFVKDPDTGRRISRPNAEDRLVYGETPDLRIVGPELWEASHARHAARSGQPPHHLRAPRHVFSGLLQCALCGRPFAVCHGKRVGCTGHSERGTCVNNTTVSVAELEARVADGVQARLLSPQAMQAYVAEYHAERERLRAAERTEAEGRRRRLFKIETELDRLVDAIAQGLGKVDRVRDRILALERERAEVAAEAAGADDERIVSLHPRLMDRYKRRVGDLCAALAGDPERRREALAILRDFIDRIEIGPRPMPGAPVPIVAHGLLPRVLHYAARREQKANVGTVMLVAGGGYRRSRTRQTLRVDC